MFVFRTSIVSLQTKGGSWGKNSSFLFLRPTILTSETPGERMPYPTMRKGTSSTQVGAGWKGICDRSQQGYLLKIDGPRRWWNFLLKWPLFRGHVNFFGGDPLKQTASLPLKIVGRRFMSSFVGDDAIFSVSFREGMYPNGYPPWN